MRKFLSLFAVLVLYSVLAFAQNRVVTGKIVDDQNNPIPFATVKVKNTTRGTTSDADGNFKIDLGTSKTLVFSSTGYADQEISPGERKQVIIKLASSTKTMDEIIVTAGGIKAKRKEIGTANTVIKAEDLTAGKSTSISGGLQGKVAGLQINATGGGVNPSYRLVLRGQRSITGNNQALLVLDNVIVPNDVLGNLNPEDVEDVVVLNGAGAAALYGSQASNGAVVVTTKRGKKGVTTVTLSNTTTATQVAFFPKIQKKFGAGGTGYSTDVNGQPEFSYLENQSYGPAFDGTKRPLGPALEDGSQDSAYYAYNDGHNKFWQTGITNQTDFSITSGDDISTMYLSAQYLNTTGTTPGDKYNRASLRANGSRKVGSKINASYSIAYVQNRYDQTSQTSSMYGNMLNMPSNVDITKYKNWRTDKFANPNGFYNPWYQNPYFTADNYRIKTRNDYLTGNLEMRFAPIKGLEFIARQGITTRNYSYKQTQGAFNYTDYAKHTDGSSKSDIPAAVWDQSGYTTQLLSDLFAQYYTKYNDFDFKLIAGGQWRQDESKTVSVSASGLVIPTLYNVVNGVGTPGASEGNYKARQIGAYGDLRIGFRNYLYLHGTARQDWVSVLSPENRAFFYPSVDLSFIASDALDFLKESNTISYLKFRGGWSKVGQVNLRGTFGAYQLEAIANVPGGFPFGSLAAYTVGNTLVSQDLKPEITKGYEFGFDLNLFKDRFTSNVTWYKTKTDNQTVETSVSSTTGFSALRTNVGQTQSQGLEVTAHYTPIKNADWTVTVGGNYTYLDNKVNFIKTDLPRLILSTSGSASSAAQAGMVFPVIMGYDYKRDGEGHVIVDGITGLPTKSDTISYLGNAVAKHRVSFDGSIRFKNFTLSVLFEYRDGYKIFNGMGTELDWSGTGYRTALYDRQRFVFPNSVIADPSNPGKYIKNTDITVKNGNGNNGFWSDNINRDVTSNYVTSGAFLKLREAVLSYNVPMSVLKKTKAIKGLTISVQGRNLLMFMAKDNYYTDPEYSAGGSDTNGIGLNSLGQTPPTRYYGGTVTFKF
ncbi:MAG: SusC/RagA family TonB-linked outer membrane protein [Chitinophagaceae bacterium]